MLLVENSIAGCSNALASAPTGTPQRIENVHDNKLRL